uniref:Putative secreted protein n=1 Tax=Amblyomma triste TaxID=251400 RepID=A0A023G1P5_AMBTT
MHASMLVLLLVGLGTTYAALGRRYQQAVLRFCRLRETKQIAVIECLKETYKNITDGLDDSQNFVLKLCAAADYTENEVEAELLLRPGWLRRALAPQISLPSWVGPPTAPSL